MATSTAVQVRPEVLPGLSPGAIRYAVEQLAIRAGVTSAWFQSWRIYPGWEFIDVYVVPGTNKRIRFPRCSPRTWEAIVRGKYQTVTAPRISEASAGFEQIPDFKIPFASVESDRPGLLFMRESRDSFRCDVDLLLSATLTLSRFEETRPAARDVHGRFPAGSSIAWRDGFLQRPIVDEYGLALEHVLKALLPGWLPSVRQLRVKVSHDVDEIGIPFSLRGALAKTIRDKRPLNTLRDCVSPWLGVGFHVPTTYQLELNRIVDLSLQQGIDSAVYWKASRPGPHDTGYSLKSARIRNQIKRLLARNVEMGFHPSYASFESEQRFAEEVGAVRDTLGVRELGGRQDYLRWTPEIWKRWEKYGLAYDSSVGFADCAGFRAGTCFPYRPWLWDEQREANLIEVPLLAMDSMLQSYMKLSPAQSLSVLRQLLARCRAVGGVFCLAWHNTRISHPGFLAIYKEFLHELRGTPTYNWRTTQA